MPAGIITTGAHPKLLWPGVYGVWGQTYNEYPDEYVDLYDVADSIQAYEEEVQVTGFGYAPVKAEGAGLTYDTEVQGFVTRFTHLAYALGYKVTKEEIDDNLYPIVATRRAQANAFSMRQTVETVAAGLYNDAFTGSVFTSADSQPYCSTSHVNVTGGTFSNRLSPDADLSEASLEDAHIAIMATQTDRGLKINLMAESLHVAPSEWFNANRILKSVLQADSANNNINVLKATNALPKGIKLNHYFTSAHAWFLRTNCPNGMRFFWRTRPEFDQDNDFDTKNAKASAYMRCSFGGTDVRSLFGSNGP